MVLTERQNKILAMLKESFPASMLGDEIAARLQVTKSALRTDFSILTGLKLIIAKQNRGYIYNEKIKIKYVKEFMSPQNSLDIKTSVYDAIIHLFKYDLGTLVVVENEKLAGIISRKDLLKCSLNGKNMEKIIELKNVKKIYQECLILCVVMKMKPYLKLQKNLSNMR